MEESESDSLSDESLLLLSLPLEDEDDDEEDEDELWGLAGEGGGQGSRRAQPGAGKGGVRTSDSDSESDSSTTSAAMNLSGSCPANRRTNHHTLFESVCEATHALWSPRNTPEHSHQRGNTPELPTSLYLAMSAAKFVLCFLSLIFMRLKQRRFAWFIFLVPSPSLLCQTKFISPTSTWPHTHDHRSIEISTGAGGAENGSHRTVRFHREAESHVPREARPPPPSRTFSLSRTSWSSRLASRRM